VPLNEFSAKYLKAKEIGTWGLFIFSSRNGKLKKHQGRGALQQKEVFQYDKT